MEQVQTEPVLTDLQDGVFTITLNRPKVLNAMTLEMFHDLRAAIAQAAAHQDAQVVLLKGAGGNFCSGADLSVLGSLSKPEEADSALTVINDLLTQLHYMDKPVVAMIQGVAVGAGLNLALHADFVVATREAVLQEPFVHIGLTTDFGGTYLLPRLVGIAQAKRLALLGEKISGAEAERIGLIYKAVDAEAIEQEVTQLIAALRRLPKQALAKTKEGMVKSTGLTLEQALAWEKAQQPSLILHPDFQNLVRAKMNRK
jgi:2-(1,2-epoxy-1,2-dihydrophenyl)acetyl-CoA isomerase